MTQFYRKYKNEILAVVGIIVPLFLSIAGKYVAMLKQIGQYWPYYVIIVLIIYTIATMRSRIFQHLSLYRTGTGDIDFRRVIDLACSTYYYMGMGAEELLRDIDIERYFVDRRNQGKPIKKIHFLFLHPESAFFGQRLNEVNQGRDISGIAQAKKSFLKTLHHCLASLPPDALEQYEIRYYDTKPVWLLHLFDTKTSNPNSNGPDKAILSVHLPSVHSKYSNQYVSVNSIDNHMFISFQVFFESVWANAIPASIVGEFPLLDREKKG